MRFITRSTRWLRRHGIWIIEAMIAIGAAIMYYGYFVGWWTLGLTYTIIAANPVMWLGIPPIVWFCLIGIGFMIATAMVIIYLFHWARPVRVA